MRRTRQVEVPMQVQLWRRSASRCQEPNIYSVTLSLRTLPPLLSHATDQSLHQHHHQGWSICASPTLLELPLPIGAVPSGPHTRTWQLCAISNFNVDHVKSQLRCRWAALAPHNGILHLGAFRVLHLIVLLYIYCSSLINWKYHSIFMFEIQYVLFARY